MSGEEHQGLREYCDMQIKIPSQLPSILKTYTKAAIKTHPRDLLQWSAVYFRALANGEKPPVKDRLEFPQKVSKDGLTISTLRAIHDQLQGDPSRRIKKYDVHRRWASHCLPPSALDALLEVSEMEGDCVEWPKLVGILAGTMAKNMNQTMTIVCQVMTKKQEGSEPLIKYDLWWQIYMYLVRHDGKVSKEHLHKVNNFLIDRAREQNCMIGPTDFNSPMCPPLS